MKRLTLVAVLTAAVLSATTIARRSVEKTDGVPEASSVLEHVLSRLGPPAAYAAPPFDGGTAPGLSPADASGAVSASNVVSALNNAYYFYKRLSVLLKFKNGNDFWCGGPNPGPNGCPGTFLNPTAAPLITLDPQILYDAAKARWVTTALGATSSQLSAGTRMPVTFLAVSLTADPTGAWLPYSFQSCSDARPGDQPKLGIDDFADWIVVVHSKW